MKNKLDAMLKDSLKSGDKITTATVRSIIAAALVSEKANPGKPVDYTQILQTLQKQRKQSIADYVNGNRHDLAETETKELAVIESLLPKQMTPIEVIDAMQDLKDKGCDRTMKGLIAAFKSAYPGAANGADIASAAKQLAS